MMLFSISWFVFLVPCLVGSLISPVNRVQISEQEGGRGILHERGPVERTCNNPSTASPILSPPAAALSPAPSNVSFHPSLLVSDTGPSCVFRSMRASWG
jgi:hypothetical protein